MLRVFRVLRILRLLKGAKGVRDLLMTLVLSFPALVNVFGLLALCMFIYSILGVQLFAFVEPGEVPLTAAKPIIERANALARGRKRCC